MNRCSKCKTKIVRHLWIVGDYIYCSPLCERGKDGRFADKMVKRIGVAGLKKGQSAAGKN